MANTEQAAEPTMEEILSSIRRIISDENGEEAEAEVVAPVEEQAPEEVAESLPEPEPEPEAELEVVPEPEPEPEEAAEEPEESPEEDEPEDAQPEEPQDDVLELTDVVEEPAKDDQPELAAADDLELVVPEPAPEPEPEPVAAAPAIPAGDDALKTTPIVADNTHDSAMAAFNLLAGSLLTKDGTARTLDDLVQLMLRPMLKTWLDDNLPGMVERLVRDEIERISRGHR